MVPADGRRRWPTLGPELCDWMEERLVFGPGAMLGEPCVLDDEKRALIYRLYEVFPRSSGDAGRRRFLRAGISLRKGLAKTELGAWIGAAELHPEAPVRCDGWRKEGKAWVPVGVGVRDPYIPFLAYTEEQTDRLAFGALKQILKRCSAGEMLDVWEDRVLRTDGSGYAEAVSASPNARDGERTTFQHFDETHRFVSDRLRGSWEVMLANAPKTGGWSLSTTTAFEPGEGSVAEDEMQEARDVLKRRKSSPRYFYFHRGAGDHHDLSTEAGVKDAVIDASGPAAVKWTDVGAVLDRWRTTKDRAYFERVWLNRPVASSRQMFDIPALRKGYRDERIPDGAFVVLGFDGARTRDSTGLVATDVVTGMQSVFGYWPRPDDADERWRVSEADISLAVERAFDTYDVWRLYADPFKFDSTIEGWLGEYGKDHVFEWDTRQIKKMCFSVHAQVEAIASGGFTHGGHLQPEWGDAYVEHHANARRKMRDVWLDANTQLCTFHKQRPDSLDWVDLAMASNLSWQARGDCIASGDQPKAKKRRSRMAFL